MELFGAPLFIYMKTLEQILEGLFDTDIADVEAFKPIIHLFTDTYKRFSDGNHNIKHSEETQLFNDFTRLIQELKPQTIKYNRISRMYKAKIPVMVLSKSNLCFICPDVWGWDIEIAIPDGKKFTTYRIIFEVYENNVIASSHITGGMDGYMMAENDTYWVRTLDDEVVEFIQSELGKIA